MCHTIDIPALSPLPGHDIPEEDEPIMESESEEEEEEEEEEVDEDSQAEHRYRISEDGRRYRVRAWYRYREYVPEEGRDYIDDMSTEDDEESESEDEEMTHPLESSSPENGEPEQTKEDDAILEAEPEEEQPEGNPIGNTEGVRQHWRHPDPIDGNEIMEAWERYNEEGGDDDDQMSSHPSEYESEEGQRQTVPVPFFIPPPLPQINQELRAPTPPPGPSQPSLPRSNKGAEDLLWKRLQETEALLKKRDEEILLLHSRVEIARRDAQHMEYAMRGISAGYRKALDYSWRSLHDLRMAERHQQTPLAIEQAVQNLEREYDAARENEQKACSWVNNRT